MARAQAPARLDPELVAFFTGHWTGKGKFATGAPIEADVDFKLTLDSAWLLCEHRDRPPHRYKATSMLGTDGKTGEFVGFTFDNFHGHRQWKSDGWIGGKLVLSGEFEHFIYERLSDKQFKMTYETSRGGNRAKRRLRTYPRLRRVRTSPNEGRCSGEVLTKGRRSDEVLWKLGDWLVFTRS
jgi:hypothetical protein